MIDPKYADLPGIAYDQPDVYETDDIPENEFLQDYAQENGDSVEKIYLNAADAFNIFKEKRINSKNIDFSDIISPKSKMNLHSCINEWEIFNRDGDESPLLKYQRLKKEIGELLDQISSIKESRTGNEEPKSLSDIICQIESTGKELNSMNIDKLLSKNAITFLSNFQEMRFKELKSQVEIFKLKNNIDNNFHAEEMNLPLQEIDKNGTLRYQMIYFPEKAKVQDIARISHLEKRLGYLENVIGVSISNTAKFSQIIRTEGIIKSIEKLMMNTYLLNSSQLDILENKVTSLISKIDNISQRKVSPVPDSKLEKEVSQLYDMIKQSENYCYILPHTINRMLSLNGLHGKAADFVNQLKQLEELQESICGSMINNRGLLEEMQKNIDINLQIITANISSLYDRVDKLTK